MADDKTVRALTRGLAVLEVLNHARACSLKHLHATTGIAKPTLLRLLRTLAAAGYVRRGMVDGLYRPTVNIRRLGGDMDADARLAEIAAPILDDLRNELGWPSDLAIYHRQAMEIVESSRFRKPFDLPFGIMPARDNGPLVYRVPMLLSGLGRVYLAYCTEPARQQILTELAASADPNDRLARDRRRVDRIVAATRAQRYGVRDPAYLNDVSAFAVPILGDDGLLGCINLLWFAGAHRMSDMIDAHLERVWSAAGEIAAAAAKHGISRAESTKH